MASREDKKVIKARFEAKMVMVEAFATDFKPMLNKIRELVDSGAEKELILKQVDRALNLINSMEKAAESYRRNQNVDFAALTAQAKAQFPEFYNLTEKEEEK